MRTRTLHALLTTLTCFLVSVSAQMTSPSSDDYTCSPSKPCSIGCCGNNGVCGLGPDYCAPANCTSSCDAKSECDPGWGSEWSSAEKCPLNVCCSQYGFCGTTSDFCGTETVAAPSCSGSSSNGRTIGYYEGWSITRACDGMPPEAIPAGAYTHLNYGFAYIDPESFAVAPMSESDLGLYSRFTNLKESNPGLKTWISIGGWSMNDPGQPTASTFSDLAGSASAQEAFFKSLLSFMTTYAFDGVDIDWEYPVAPERSGKPADFANYPTFLSNLKAALGSTGHSYGLSITLPSSYWYMQNFDIVKIEPIVDWFNVMTYDLHGTWDSTDPYIGPYVYAHTNLTEIDQTMDLFWRNKIDPSKITLGLGFYGRSFTLADPSCTSPGCPFSSGGNPGPCSATSGTLMSSEIDAIIAAGAVPTLDEVAAVKQIVWDDNQWVSYDDTETIGMKIDYANAHCLGGTMVWAVSTDSENANASMALQSHNGLSKKSLFGGGSTPQEPTLSQCVWGGCDEECPAGTSPAQTGTGKSASNAAIYSGCPSGKSRKYCCPSNDVPVCKWVGSAPFCSKSTCPEGQVQIATDQSGGGHSCWFNHKSLCCTASKSDAAASQCEWTGSAPFCASGTNHANCPSNYPDFVTYSPYGAGGESQCFSGYKSLCCTDPEPYQNCAWTQRPHSWLAPFTCNTGCPAGQQIVAESHLDHGSDAPCLHNTASYFCCDEFNQTAPTTDPPNFCVAASTDYVLSGQPDPDGNVADLLELYWYEDECYPIPNTGDPDSMKRWLPELEYGYEGKRPTAMPPGSRNDGVPKICNADNECYNVLSPEKDLSFQQLLSSALNHSHAVLEPRGRVAKICLPKGKSNSFKAKNYPGVQPLSTRGRQFYGAMKSGVQAGLCAALPLISGSRVLGENYVTEHVMELQTPAQFANSMLSGLLPSGATAPGSGYDWTQVFGPNGYMFQTWAQLGISPPSGFTGDTPADALYNALGSTADINNLQILDAATNSLKAGVWQLFKNIVSPTRFSKEGPKGQVEFINRLYQTLPSYLNDQAVQKSLTYGYNAIKNVMAALDSSPNVKAIPGTTFAACFKTFSQDFFSTMQSNLRTFISDKLDQVIPYWASSAAEKLFTKAGAQAVLAALQKKENNLVADVVINSGFVQ